MSLSAKDYDEDEVRFQTTCPVAKFGVGGMFGFILGYSMYNITGPSIYVILTIAASVAFGLLGSSIPDPFQLSFYDWCAVTLLNTVLSVPFYSLLEFDLIGIIFLSFLLSLISSQLLFYHALFFRNTVTYQPSDDLTV